MRILALLLVPLIALGALYLWTQQTSQVDPENNSALPVERVDPLTPGRSMGPGGGPVVPLRDVESPVETRIDAPATEDVDRRYPLELNLTLLQPGPVDAREGGEVLAGAKATLRGRLIGENGDPLVGRVEFVWGANEGRVLPCASDGSFLAGDLYPGLSIVHVVSPQGWTSEREIRLGQFGNTELNVTFATGATARVRGRVQDGFGKGIEGAKVRVDGQEAFSDPDGQFEVYRTTIGQILVEVSAEGFALYREELPIGRGVTIEPGRLVFQLEPEAVLDLELSGLAGSNRPAQVYLFPAGGQRINKQRGQRTFPWYRLNPIELRPGLGQTVRGLPEGSVTVMAFQSGAVASPERSNVKLHVGRRNSHVVQLQPGPTLTGKVQVDGKTVPNARVRLEVLDASSNTMRTVSRGPAFNLQMVVGLLPTARQQVITDAGGRFVLSTQPDLENEYMLTATNPEGTWRKVMRLTGEQLGSEVMVELEPASKDKGSLALTLKGVARSVPYRVRVEGADGGVAVVGPGETLHVADLPAGLWRLDASRYGRYATRGLRFWIEADREESQELNLPDDLWKDPR
ncbi:MAG: carboxypeptidase-like regulatory domain-containing protein [Planctomycetota bacterium]